MSENKYSLNVHISGQCLNALKDSQYSLCIAKEVSGKRQVVFNSEDDYMEKNRFEFEDSYKVFGAKKFEVGALVEALTSDAKILPGQEITMNPAGTFNRAAGPVDYTKPFVIHNQRRKAINFGVKALIGGEFKIMYNSETPYLGGDVFLLPKKMFTIWFEKNGKDRQMFSHALTNSLSLDFTGATEITINYTAPKDAPAQGIWSYGSLPVFGQTYHPQTNTFSLNRANLPTTDELAYLAKVLRLEPPSKSDALETKANGNAQLQLEPPSESDVLAANGDAQDTGDSK